MFDRVPIKVHINNRDTMKKYIKPEVRLISKPKVDYLGFYQWMKSRQWIITDIVGQRFMTEIDPSIDINWYKNIPDQFFVGDELVRKSEYLDRISTMNLQYNNSESLTFEIKGSCLFRDFLYNINKSGQWAQSNRFLFSILDKDAMYDESNYTISQEYKGIRTWEDQFDSYMEAIRRDPIVDHNRLEMPYSISSTFWYTITKTDLIYLIKYLHQKMPFFFNHYGIQFLRELFPNKKVDTKSWLESTKDFPAFTQYEIKSELNGVYPNLLNKESIVTIGDTVVLDTNLSLILYSQFIRQSNTLVSGLFNLLIHKDPDEFADIVFSGKTLVPVHYVADIDKVMHTIRNRTCAFAMSSGTGPDSWSYFINQFLPENLNGDQLIKYLPCKFEGYKLINCKFHDDIKFRNEGKEHSNCPCPLALRSLEAAKLKHERDKNRLSKAYLDLTIKMLSVKTDKG